MGSSGQRTAFDWELYRDRAAVLQSYRDSREYTDCVVAAEDGTSFPVHAVVVSALGEHITQLMMRQVREPNCETAEIETASGSKHLVKKVVIPGIDSSVLRILIDTAYTGHLAADAVTVWKILDAAERFKMREVENGCCTFISQLVTKENCLMMYRLGKQKHHVKLLTAALTAMKHNLRFVADQVIFYTMIDSKDLGLMLSADDLDADREEYVWTIIKSWVMHDVNRRYSTLTKLISNLRFQRTSPEFLVQLSQEWLIRDQRQHGSLVATVRRMISSRNRGGYSVDGWKLPVGIFPDLVRPRTPNNIVFAIGGWQNGQVTNLIECYDRSTNLWFSVPENKSGPKAAYRGIQYLDGKLYMIGGTDSQNVLDKLCCFDPVTYEWDNLSPMQYKRCYVSTAVHDGKIYAMGGHNGDFRMRYAERYDPRIDEWEPIADMIIARSDANAVVVNDRIYICGGLNENMIERTAEVYDPQTNTWSLLPPMTTPRSSVAVVALNNQIYAVGGNSGEQRLKTVERLDLATNQWEFVADMIQRRSTFTATVLDGKIIACGGYSGSSPFNGVESYDPATNQWTPLMNMQHSRSGLSVITISDLPNARDFTFLGNVRSPNLRI